MTVPPELQYRLNVLHEAGRILSDDIRKTLQRTERELGCRLKITHTELRRVAADPREVYDVVLLMERVAPQNPESDDASI